MHKTKDVYESNTSPKKDTDVKEKNKPNKKSKLKKLKRKEMIKNLNKTKTEDEINNEMNEILKNLQKF
jgi:cytochrome c553